MAPTIALADEFASKLLWRNACSLLESDAKAVGALVTAHIGEHFELVIGIGKQALGALDAHALQFLPGRAPDSVEKCLVQSAPRHRRLPG